MTADAAMTAAGRVATAAVIAVRPRSNVSTFHSPRSGDARTKPLC
ncbi:hypothetical protein [Pseudonocardia yunnanensis]|uniref:Uncharacterized protein n=1 Tax=Pseudonocardia yunnanensis TaxID=58107 RepID=A0ABW4F0V1_9PSEU